MCKRDVEKRTAKGAKDRKEHVQISSLFKTSKQLALLAVLAVHLLSLKLAFQQSAKADRVQQLPPTRHPFSPTRSVSDRMVGGARHL
jgi:hypothetical protein